MKNYIGCTDEAVVAGLPEDMKGIAVIKCDSPRADGTTVGMFSVDGYYKLPGSEVEIRQMRRYDVNSFEEAHERAKRDGLSRGVLVEKSLTELQRCVLGKVLEFIPKTLLGEEK